MEGAGLLLGSEGHDDDGDEAGGERPEDDPEGEVARLVGMDVDRLHRGLRDQPGSDVWVRSARHWEGKHREHGLKEC